ncbi:MAG TPA: nascent polypeptide-associated complex protein [Candidatus Acidoferrum sp.]|nr:nascent polypeptide-associated complex protein [Candidatus Acidoferrum sp.]
MMPNMDPRALKSMMEKMGIKTSEIDATSVVIHCAGKDLVISNPQVTQIDAQGATSFQVAGVVEEKEVDVSVEITDDDVKTVMDQAGIDDEERARAALKESNGDIAGAIIKLNSQ